MLILDRYLRNGPDTRDLATDRPVDLVRSRSTGREPALFETDGDRTRIDWGMADGRPVEVWERWHATGDVGAVSSLLTDCIEAMECARWGAPRALAIAEEYASLAGLVRRLIAREARVHGWIPVALEVLTRHFEEGERTPEWAAGRSLVLLAEADRMTPDAARVTARALQHDARPHIIVRLPRWPTRHGPTRSESRVADESHARGEWAALVGDVRESGCFGEARARWPRLLEGLVTSRRSAAAAVQLAEVLVARDQAFEARALAETVGTNDAVWAARASVLVSSMNDRAVARTRKGWEMVDDFVDVLQLCQDVEDEQTLLARVSAFVRDRLQASSVAFVARDGCTARVLTRVGSTSAGVDLAMRTIESGVTLAPDRPEGPVESACPVRHAAEVIGALWCRWSAGTPVASSQATTLLGVAAAAAPSVRLALTRISPSLLENPVPELVGESELMVSVRAAIVRAAASPFPVVIEGESGAGKELAARAIHARSPRRDRRFVAMNCAALVDDLVEAELFGHVKGSFTGAHTDRSGVFEDASGGTLFLDEVAEMGPRVQAKLLRVLQESEVRRVGETAVRKIDVRVVAATNRPLAQEVAAGRFRSDLWYRLDVVRITLPPLRERIEDLPVLAHHLWHSLVRRTGSRAALLPATVAALASYNWPGNIRELQNVLASMLVSAPRGGLVGPASLPAHVARVAATEREATLAAARRQFEQRYVRAALARAGGRTSAAARQLGVSRQGLSKLMARLAIEQPAGPAVDARAAATRPPP